MELAVIIVNAAALFLLWLFAVTGAHKLRSANTDYYVNVFADYGVPAALANSLLVKLVGCLEIMVGVLIAVPTSRAAGALAAAIILAAYLLLMARQLWLGKRDVDCGCAGPLGDAKISPQLLYRNAALVVLALFCWQPVQTITGYLALPGAAPALMLTGLLTAIMIMLYLSIEQLISNGQKLERLRRR